MPKIEAPTKQQAAKLKLPKTLAACADLLYKTREERLAKDREVDALRALETALQDKLIAEVSTDSNGVLGKVALVRIETKSVPAAKDWDAIYKWMAKYKRFDLLQRRLSDKVVAELWAAGKTVPGVETFNVKKVSCTKQKGV